MKLKLNFDPLGLKQKDVKKLSTFQKTNILIVTGFVMSIATAFVLFWGTVMGNILKIVLASLNKLRGG